MRAGLGLLGAALRRAEERLDSEMLVCGCRYATVVREHMRDHPGASMGERRVAAAQHTASLASYDGKLSHFRSVLDFPPPWASGRPWLTEREARAQGLC